MPRQIARVASAARVDFWPRSPVPPDAGAACASFRRRAACRAWPVRQPLPWPWPASRPFAFPASFFSSSFLSSAASSLPPSSRPGPAPSSLPLRCSFLLGQLPSAFFCSFSCFASRSSRSVLPRALLPPSASASVLPCASSRARGRCRAASARAALPPTAAAAAAWPGVGCGARFRFRLPASCGGGGGGAAAWVFMSHTSASTATGSLFCQLMPINRKASSSACTAAARPIDGQRLGSGGTR